MAPPRTVPRRLLPQLLVLAVLLAALPFAPASADTSTTQVIAPSGVVVSTQADRSSPVAIEDAALKGNAYVFMDVARNIKSVTYYIDDPDTKGNPYRASESHPFDLAGANGNLARPLDTTSLADGGYTLTAVLEYANRRVQVVHAPVVVSNEEVIESTPAPDPGPEPTPDPEPNPEPTTDPEPPTAPGDTRSRLLYSDEDIVVYQSRMSGKAPFYKAGDAGHGGQYSPGDGQRSEALAQAFLANPGDSYWSQPNLPFSQNDPWPNGMQYVRPMHAAWLWMTQPSHPQRDALHSEVKNLLLAHAADPTHDYSNSTNYPVNYPGFAPSPIFNHAQWFTRLVKTRDMLGREAFTAAENQLFDRWVYDYANWTANWLHKEIYVKQVPGRLNRDYSTVRWSQTPDRKSYDNGPLIGSSGRAYTNRHAASASTMSLAANYLKHFDYKAPTSGGPSYGRYTVDQLLDHSRLFVEETIRFSVWPQGFQGDFERGHSGHPQLGWLYSANVLANLVEMAEAHAKRGDMSVWQYGTTAGWAGSAGTPVAGGFSQKNLHFYAWSMSRYMNNGWQRTNFGEPLTRPHFYHDVIPAATVHRLAPHDTLLEAAWKRQGMGMPSYPQSPQSQGSWSAHLGEAAKMLGVIEHGGLPTLRP